MAHGASAERLITSIWAWGDLALPLVTLTPVPAPSEPCGHPSFPVSVRSNWTPGHGLNLSMRTLASVVIEVQ